MKYFWILVIMVWAVGFSNFEGDDRQRFISIGVLLLAYSGSFIHPWNRMADTLDELLKLARRDKDE